MVRVTLAQLQEATAGRVEGSAPQKLPIRRFVCDSREVNVGDVFWALPGAHHDGREFVSDAFQRGAWGCVLSGSADGLAEKARRALRGSSADGLRFLLWTEDSQSALMDLARWYRTRISARVVAVTGTVGKTTTREMIHAVLRQKRPGTRSPKNYNNHLGVPLTLLEVGPHHQYVVIELGASALGEIERLCRICQPEIGVLTSVGPAHLEGFGGLSAVARAKAELLASLPSNGLAVLAGDDARVRRLGRQAACRVVTVGQKPSNDWVAAEIDSGRDGLSFTIRCRREHPPAGERGETQRVTVPVVGRHHVTSALCAAAVGVYLGLSLEEVAKGLADFQPPAGRCRVVRLGSVTVIDDSYNASPLSMEAALEVLADWPADGRRIFVAGDMRELGRYSRRYHQALGRRAAEKADKLLAIGRWADEVVRAAQEAGMAAEDALVVDHLDELSRCLHEELRPGDSVLVKGSRALGLEKVVDDLRCRWTEEAACPVAAN